MADLPSGQYTITAARSQFPIGRMLAEDRSLSPKRVMSLPLGQDQSFEAHTRWIFIRDGDSYTLKVLGAPTAEIEGYVFAVLLDDPSPEKWKIVPATEAGDLENAYTITTEDGQLGWAHSDAPFSQIEIRPASDDFNQLFIIKPLSD